MSVTSIEVNKIQTYKWHEFDKAEQEGLEIFRRATDNCTANHNMHMMSKQHEHRRLQAALPVPVEPTSIRKHQQPTCQSIICLIYGAVESWCVSYTEWNSGSLLSKHFMVLMRLICLQSYRLLARDVINVRSTGTAGQGRAFCAGAKCMQMSRGRLAVPIQKPKGSANDQWREVKNVYRCHFM